MLRFCLRRPGFWQTWPPYGQSTKRESGVQVVWLKQVLDFEGWNSQVHRSSPEFQTRRFLACGLSDWGLTAGLADFGVLHVCHDVGAVPGVCAIRGKILQPSFSQGQKQLVWKKKNINTLSIVCFTKPGEIRVGVDHIPSSNVWRAGVVMSSRRAALHCITLHYLALHCKSEYKTR